jgi:HEPN domain-containing protein
VAARRQRRPEVEDALAQARRDLKNAEAILATEAYEVVAFLCQQSVEKGLKALYLHLRRKRADPTHDLVKLGEQVSAPASLATALGDLTADYTTARYPEAANGVPFKVYTKERALARLEAARKVWGWLDPQF